jgi:hypothetical protein
MTEKVCWRRFAESPASSRDSYSIAGRNVAIATTAFNLYIKNAEAALRVFIIFIFGRQGCNRRDDGVTVRHIPGVWLWYECGDGERASQPGQIQQVVDGY